MKSFLSITNTGITNSFSIYASGASLASTAGIREVRMNKVGANGPLRVLADGSRVLSLRVSVVSAATKPSLAIAGGAAGAYSDFRITGKLGSASIRITDNNTTVSTIGGAAISFNQLAAETGVVFTSSGDDLNSVGFGSDDFVKVEYIGGSGAAGMGGVAGVTIGGVGGADAIGTTRVAHANAANVRVNGTSVTPTGEFGTTVRYLADGYDVEIDLTTRGVGATGVHRFNTQIDQGIAGILGPGARSSDAIRYGVGNFTTANLGRGNGLNSGSIATGAAGLTAALGNKTLANDSVANIGSGGALSLASTRLNEAMGVVDRAVNQVVREQARLGTIQSNFMDAVARAEVTQGNVNAADADILGVDAAAEITNLVQAQVGVATATALSSQITTIQQTVLSMLR
jgi:flagellin-like hook-associated protein FlgL